MDEFIRLQIKDQNFPVFLRSDEQPVARNVRGQVVEITVVKFW